MSVSRQFFIAPIISIHNTTTWLHCPLRFLIENSRREEKKLCCNTVARFKGWKAWPEKMVSVIKAAIGDLVLTFFWVVFSSMLGLATDVIKTALDLRHASYNGFDYAGAVIITSLIFILVTIFTFIGNALGGASFNPTGNASSYAAGVGDDTLFSMALRFPAQVC